MDPGRREALRAERDGALKKRARLDAVIEYLNEELGEESPQVSTSPGESGSQGNAGFARTGASPGDVVSPGEFFGMSGPKAAKALLRKFGRERPLTTDELFDGVRAGGVEINSKDGLYRSFFRDDDFVKVGKGVWGLAEWYPANARKKAKAEQEAEAASLGLAADGDDEIDVPDGQEEVQAP